MVAENWQITSPVFDLDDQGYGTVVYQVEAKHGTFSYVLFSHYLDPENRNDRVIANQWDLTMALCEGTVDTEQLEFLRANVPKQEAGRVDSRVLVLSRANRSARTFDYVVDELTQGRQPNVDVIAEVGYLYRTTAAYGSGKLGMADWEKVRTKHRDFARPFAAEMFTCYMLRHFSMQQADYLAAQRSPETAVTLHRDIKRYLGIGNSTGLGMAPFLINHPLLINQWIEMRETALATAIVAGEAGVDKATMARLDMATERVIQHLGEIITADERQSNSNVVVREELQALHLWLQEQAADLAITHYVWADLIQYAEQHWHIETQEVINTMLIELYPDLVDGLEEQMGTEESQQITPEMSVSELLEIIEDKYDWALAIDFSKHESNGVHFGIALKRRWSRVWVRPILIWAWKKKCPWVLVVWYGNVTTFCSITTPSLQSKTSRILLCSVQITVALWRGFKPWPRVATAIFAKIWCTVMSCRSIYCAANYRFLVSVSLIPRSRLWVRNTMFQGAPLISDFGSADMAADDWQFPIKPVMTSL